ncbi:hypothetical protein LEMLEM_LOCUS17288, partial [Lemmus lemmus]
MLLPPVCSRAPWDLSLWACIAGCCHLSTDLICQEVDTGTFIR